MNNKRIMREVFIEQIYNRMAKDDSIFFITADFGSPKLDKLRKEFKNRFVNVGIAEQNLINVAAGLALEGYSVYAYAIAPFLVMRAYEQIRNNLSLLSHTNEINVNLIGVGAGLSYDVSGPTHHSIEDISIIRTLPNINIFSPSDCVLTEKFFEYSIKNKKPKYIRLDGKPVSDIYERTTDIDMLKGFFELSRGEQICIVSTGYMTHTALKVIDELNKNKISVGLIDVFMIKPVDENQLFEAIKKYNFVVTIEEGFIKKGGLDSLIDGILTDRDSSIKLRRLGFSDDYVFDIGHRESLHKMKGLSEASIIENIKNIWSKH
jgi:transketolase